MDTLLKLLKAAGRRKTIADKLTHSGSPEKLLLFAFLIVILIGSFLLHLPLANAVKPVSYIDNLFVAVSAVCVTGLTTVTAATQYNLFGKIVLIVLMEIGGLGPMTIIAVILLQNRRQMDTVEKRLFAAGAGKSDLYDVPQYIRRIFRYTLFFETAGFILLSIRFVQLLGWKEGLFDSLFLSVSAFTNAGFDCLGADSLIPYAADPWINLPIIFLIVTGGLGFVVWFEMFDLLRHRMRWRDVFHQSRRVLSVHARIVLKTTVILLISGTVLFGLMESENPLTIASMPASEKLLVSLFQSVTLRTAGFSTVNIGSCTRPVLLFMCAFMLVGGSPGGTAGGIKTTTAAVLYVTTANTLSQKHLDAVVGHRRISAELLKHAFMILSLYMAIIFLMTTVLVASEPGIGLLQLVFEVFSAIATVGITAGITGSLSLTGKIVIMILMFIGRLGPLSLYAAFHKPVKTRNHVQYPDANIIIG